VAPFEITSRREDDRFVVALAGELDIATAESARNELARRKPGEGLVLDLSRLGFLDTSGIQLVVEAYRAARDEGFELRILRAPPDVHRVFEIAGLDGVLPFTGPGDA
jgi:anti-sigma B factor antagonist